MMEELCEVHCDDNNASPEKKQKRIVKTPLQVEALEKFYEEHNYPTESMKSDLAKSLGLTEKQVSGWFCHRRLKEKKQLGELHANGRHDRSSGVVQDRGSGFGQDSCGSTKQGEYRHFDTREVESRRFTCQDLSAADFTYRVGSHDTRNCGGVDDTSSGSSSPLRDRFLPQNEGHVDMLTSRYVTRHENIVPIDVKGIKPRIGPSGYLKVKGQVENAAITTVRRKLGSYYREDGPPLGVEFQPLPPGAFESSIRDSVNEPFHDDQPILPHSPDDSKACNQSEPNMRFQAYNSMMSSHKSDTEGTRLKLRPGSDYCEDYSRHQFKQKSFLSNQRNYFHGQNSSIELNEDSAGETSVYYNRSNFEKRAKHGAGEISKDFFASHYSHPYHRKVSNQETEFWLHSYDDLTPKFPERGHFKSKNSNLTLKHGGFLDAEDRVLSRRVAKIPVQDKLYGGLKQ